MGARRVIVNTDSKLIAGQNFKSYRARKLELAEYLEAVRCMERHSFRFSIRPSHRLKNKEADKLAKAATSLSPLPPDVFYEVEN